MSNISAEILIFQALGIILIVLPLVIPIFKTKNLGVKLFWIVFWLIIPFVAYGLMLVTEHMPGSIMITLVLLPFVYLVPIWVAKSVKKAGEFGDASLGLFYTCVSGAFGLLPAQGLVYGMLFGTDQAGGVIFMLLYTLPVACILYFVLSVFIKE